MFYLLQMSVSRVYGRREIHSGIGGNVKGKSCVSMWVSDLKITANLTEKRKNRQLLGLKIQGEKCKMLPPFKNQCGKINKVQI